MLALQLADSIGLHFATGLTLARLTLPALFTFYSKGNEQKSGPSGATELGDIVKGNSGSKPSALQVEFTNCTGGNAGSGP